MGLCAPGLKIMIFSQAAESGCSDIFPFFANHLRFCPVFYDILISRFSYKYADWKQLALHLHFLP